jgi:UDP-hydrolysing UDP-N-acetyl-D-glucosamine 2-epimerase
LIRSGEDPNRVKVTGAPQIDDMVSQQLPTVLELKERTVVNVEKFVLSVFHGVTEDLEASKKGIELLIEALTEIELPIIWIGSNNDTLGSFIERKVIASLRVSDKFYSNLNRIDYLAILANCEFIIGNSSSGILEAPTFSKPAVNLGRRQADRFRGDNVIDCDYSKEEIVSAILKARSDPFKLLCMQSKNPYGSGDSSKQILDALENTEVNSNFLIKRITF